MEKKIGVDTAVLIYLLEEHPQYIERVERLFHDIENGKTHAVFSVIGMIELLTGPKKLKRYDMAARYRELFSHFPNLNVAGINERIVELSSDLRAQYGIGTPDAIHVATAIDFGADAFVTNDKRLKKVKEIGMMVIGK